MVTQHQAPPEPVWGISAIAQIIGRSERQTQSMLSAGRLPAKQIGKLWVSERGALKRFFEEIAA